MDDHEYISNEIYDDREHVNWTHETSIASIQESMLEGTMYEDNENIILNIKWQNM